MIPSPSSSCSDSYVPPETSRLSPREWLGTEKARLRRIGMESGQRLIYRFDKNPRLDTVENLGRFERPICDPNARAMTPATDKENEK